MTVRSQSRRGWMVALLAGVLFAAPALSAMAAQLPSAGSNLFIQTSGPSAGLNIGDYYTSPTGGDTDHLFLVRVPSNWPAGEPVTIALYDPELALPNPVSPAAIDEIRGTADAATFSLEAPNGSTIASRTYSDSSTNGLWAHLATFDPGTSGTGSYLLHVTVTGDDDNSWRMSASYDPDCVVGGPDTCAGVVDGNESDTAPSGSGPIGLGTLRTSYQHGAGGQSCQDHVFYVGSSLPRPLRAHNFDMDNNGSVTYTDPNGVSTSGTVSANARWNNSSDETRVGDVLADANGWWTATICISSGNQYVFEAPGVSPTFPVPQPTPRIEVSKDDALANASVGDDLTYVIDVTNVSDTDSLPGDAHSVVVVDQLPDGLTFTGCTAPAGVSCVEATGTVTATFDSPLAPGETVSLTISATVDAYSPTSVDNTAVVSYDDRLGNKIEDASASDTTEIDFAPSLNMTSSGSARVLRGSSVSLGLEVTHDASSDGSPVSSVALACPVCVTANFVSGDDNGDDVLDFGEVWSYEAIVATDGTTPDPLPVDFDVSGSDTEGDTITAQTAHPLDLVEPGMIGGSVFEDIDGDGIRDSDEPGIDAAQVSLSGESAASTTSDVDGAYEFTGLFPGSYTVETDMASLPVGLLATNTVPGVDLPEGGSITGVDFGYAYPVSITGSVFADNDFDGLAGVGEAGIASVRVALLDGGGAVVAETASDGVGQFSFTAAPGTSSVAIVGGVPYGWSHTTAEMFSLGLIPSGENVDAPAFGLANRPPVLDETYQIIAVDGAPDSLPATDPEDRSVSFAIVAGDLPAGLGLNSDGTFTGTATEDGVHNLDLMLCDDGNPGACEVYQWQLRVVLPLVADVGVSELPFTGIDMTPMAVLAILLLTSGISVVWRGRYPLED